MANLFAINSVTQSGRLTRDPELRQTPSGTSVCQFSIAQNAGYKDSAGQWQERPLYFNCVAWASQAESVVQRYHKGDLVVVDGRLDFQHWEAQDGTKRSKVEIIAESVVPGMGKRADKAADDQTPDDDFRDIDFGGDDIPF